LPRAPSIAAADANQSELALLFTEWKLGELVPKFQEQGMSVEDLPRLTDDDLKELIPKVCARGAVQLLTPRLCRFCCARSSKTASRTNCRRKQPKSSRT